MKISLFILLSVFLFGCGNGRNFEGAPNEFLYDELSDSTVYYPEYLYGFNPTVNGFDFRIFQKSESGAYGSSLVIQVNLKTMRLILGNISVGEIVCETLDDLKSCSINWLTDADYYGFNREAYSLKFKMNKVSAVLGYQNIETLVPESCVSVGNEALLEGEKLTISLIDSKTETSKEIIFFNFGTENFGSFSSSVRLDLTYYYAFDFNSFFPDFAYFFNMIEVRERPGFNFFRVGARALDNVNNKFVHYCFYDTK